MKSNTLAILILAYCILVACTRTSPNAQLVQADSLMQKFPDSALRFLQKIRPEELNSLEDRAYHALLLTEVKDKNFIQQTEDSQIRIAVQYYDSIKDIPMQAKSYYYWGCIRRDQNNHPDALKKFFTAITHAQSISDNKLAGYIYNNIANLYLLQRLNEQADSIYQITERLAIQEKDSNLLADVLSQRGMIDINRGKEYYSEAEQKILLAFKISRHIAQRNLMAKTAYSLSLLYGRMNMGKEAVEFAKLSLNNQDNVKMLYRGYLLLGDAYYKTVQYDSALIYLNKALYSRDHSTKAGIYMRLADIAQKQGKLEQALEMEDLGIEGLRKAKPVFKKFVRTQPANGNYNLWYGVCCLETGEPDVALKYLETAVKKRIPSGQLYLARNYNDLYRFEDAIKCYEEYISDLSKRKRSTAEAEKLLEKSKTNLRMLKGIEEVCIIDSIVVDKDRFLEAYKISPESGKLFTYNDFFQNKEEVEATVYETELGNKIY